MEFDIPDDCNYINILDHWPDDYLPQYIRMPKSKIDKIVESQIMSDDEIADLKSALITINLAKNVHTSDNCYIRHGTGIIISAENFKATDFIDISGINTIVYTRLGVNASAPSHGMAFYDENKTYISGIGSYINTSGLSAQMYTVDVPENAVYARFTWRMNETPIGEFKLFNADQAEQALETKTSALETRVAILENGMGPGVATKKYVNDALEGITLRNNGVLNVIARARFLTDIVWTPIRPVPNQKYVDGSSVYGRFPAGEAVTGVPYAAQLRFELWMGRCISLETFISALANPNSVMYDDTRADGRYYRSSAWYSINCSKFAGFCLGLKKNYPSGGMTSDPNVSLVKQAGAYTADEINIGDIIESPGVHTAFVTDKIYDTYGDVVQIEISEAVTPSCRRKRWNCYGSIDNFFEHFASYNLERYSLIDSVPPIDYLTPFPYVSKTLGLNFGNKSNYILGDIVKITLLAKEGNELTITKDGVLHSNVDVSGYSEGDEITLSIDSAGTYVVNFTDGDNVDAVTFIMNDPVAVFDSGTSVLTFSCSTATLDMAGTRTDGSRVYIKDVIPTAADLSNGYMSLNISSTAKYIHAFFKTVFGIFNIELPVE